MRGNGLRIGCIFEMKLGAYEKPLQMFRKKTGVRIQKLSCDVQKPMTPLYSDFWLLPSFLCSKDFQRFHLIDTDNG